VTIRKKLLRELDDYPPHGRYYCLASKLHLGTYLGAIVKFVEMPASHDCIY